MATNVLVAYATKYGATAEIAERIGAVIRDAGLKVDVLPADRVRDLKSYKAVILGSAVYIGQWRKQAAKFLTKNEESLAGLPVWLFSSGPTGEGDPVELVQGWRFPKKLQSVADRIKPRDTILFHGAVDDAKIGGIARMMLNNVGALSGDFRDWDVIESWARSIAQSLKD